MIHDRSAPITQSARRSQSGNVMVQAAFAVPIFVILLMGMVDVGLWVVQTSQVTGAAADGARAGIIWHTDSRQSDVVGSPAHNRIRDAVNGRLVGSSDHTFQVRCVNRSRAAISCSVANPNMDLIEVSVQKPMRALSPIGAVASGSKIDSTVTMEINRLPDASTGAPAPTTPPTTTPSTTTPPAPTTTDPSAPTTQPPPTTTPPPEPCQVAGVSTTPTIIDTNGSGKLSGPVTITIQTVGECSNIRAELSNQFLYPTQNGSTFVAVLPAGYQISVKPPATVPLSVYVNSVLEFSTTVRVEK